MRKRNPVHLPRLPLEGCERKRVAMLLAELLEATMLICFGLSWPMNAWKSYRARTAKGTSWQFLTLICLGYLCGIAAKIALGAMNWVFWIYVLNLAFLGINWVIYFRNRRFDAERRASVLASVPPSLRRTFDETVTQSNCLIYGLRGCDLGLATSGCLENAAKSISWLVECHLATR